jgi:DNA-binding FrmR family transcriptional regulator
MPAKPTSPKMRGAGHANHSEDLLRLRRIRGQVEGVERMIEEGRYCVDIVNQIRAIMAALRATEGLVLERHIRHCVKDAVVAASPRATEEKINELLALFNKR